MSGDRSGPIGGGGNVEDRLARLASMLDDAVGLLHETMQEIKGERGHPNDDGSTAGAPERRDK